MKYLSLLLLAGWANLAAAQNPTVLDTLLPCGVTGSFLEKNIDPQLLRRMNAQWQEYSKQGKANGRLSADDPVLVVPVMFHIAHLGEPVGEGSNLSEGRIQAALANLNNIYRARGQYIGANDTRIEFVLANCSGIDRANASGVPDFINKGVVINGASNQQQVKNIFGTYQNKFINIYVSHMITDYGGFAYYGGELFITMSGLPNKGSQPEGVRLLAHELGHSLFLNHTFAGDNSCLGCSNNNVVCPANGDPFNNGDQVADTPPHRVTDLNSYTPAYAINPCTNEPFGLDLVKNHMAYNTDASRFSPGQIARMRFYLENYLSYWRNSDAIPTPNHQLSLSSVPTSVCANSSITIGYGNDSGSPNPVFLIQKGDDVVHYVDVAGGLANFTFPATYFNGNFGPPLPSGDDYRIRIVAGCNSRLSAPIQYGNLSAYQASIVGADGEPLPNINTLTDVSVNLCEGSSITLKARLTYTHNGAKYMAPESELAGLTFQWTLNGGNLPDATGSSYTVSGTGGTYRYAVTNSGCANQGMVSSYSVNATFVQTPTAITSDFDDGRIPLKNQCWGSSLKLHSNYISNSAVYYWQKDGVRIPNETGRTLVVNSTGNYRVIPGDGTCYFRMNVNKSVAVNIGDVLENYIIPPVDSLVCNSEVFLRSVGWAEGLSYQWFRNGVAIPKIYQNYYATNQEGVYSLKLRQGNCTSVSNAVRLYKSAKEPKPIISAPDAFADGFSYNLSITNARGSWQWLKDDQPIENAHNTTLQISTPGVYKVRSGYDACIIDSDPVVANFGNSLSTLIVAQDSVRLLCNGFTTAAILSYQPQFVDDTPILSLRWTKDGIDIPLSNMYADKSIFYAFEDGVYRLRTSSGAASGISNPITVTSTRNRTVRLTSTESVRSVCEGNVIKLTFPQNSIYNFFLIWRKDGVVIPNQEQSELTVLQSGSYTATYPGYGCTVTTEPLPLTIGSGATSATLNGDYAIRAGETANLLLNASAGLTYFFQLSDGSEYTGQGTTTLIPKNPSLSTTYTLTSFVTHCGTGNASGVGRIDVTNCPVDAVNYTLASGFWDSASNWSCGSIPTVLDPVRISDSHTVNLPPNYEAKSKSIELLGKIQQDTNANLQIGPQ